jgi:transposase-like protein
MRKIKHYSSEQKVEALKRYFVGKEEISKICEELKIPPSTFHGWQQKFFDNAHSAFEKDAKQENKAIQDKVDSLEYKLRKKDNVISELMEETINLKKNLGLV